MRTRRIAVFAVALSLVAGAACTGDGGTAATTTTRAASRTAAALTLRVVDRHPHDTDAFTEGLTFDEWGRLYESLGLEGQSSVRQVDPETGKVIHESRLADDQFGEGLAIRGLVLYQLTWKSGVVRLWTLDTLQPAGEDRFTGEGWGLTFDGTSFIQSDGSSRLIGRYEDYFEPPISSTEVTLDGEPVDELNELEWVDGVIWANVWHSDQIMRIDPGTGNVTGVLDASSLWQDEDRTSEMTLNGIAHRPGDPPNRLWLTGKNWPEIFEVEVTDP